MPGADKNKRDDNDENNTDDENAENDNDEINTDDENAENVNSPAQWPTVC